MDNKIYIDGSFGEGGGQILRSSLSLSMITGIPFEMKNIRAGRSKPGLMRQHLTCVKAAAEICDAKVKGAEIGSQKLSFNPGAIKGGKYEFSIGTAGSTMLVFQTVLPALLMADGVSRVTLQGGTHNINAPHYDFVEQSFVPVLRQMGADVKCTLGKYGFYPTGGGRVVFDITPVQRLQEVRLVDQHDQEVHCAEALVANLPIDIARRELATIGEVMRWGDDVLHACQIEGTSSSGNVVLIKVTRGGVTEIITGYGKLGVRSEKIAEQVCKKARAFLSRDVVVGEYLADQLLLPMALSGAGAFKTVEPSLHTKTNIEVIQKFLPCDIDVDVLSEHEYMVSFDGEPFVNTLLQGRFLNSIARQRGGGRFNSLRHADFSVSLF